MLKLNQGHADVAEGTRPLMYQCRKVITLECWNWTNNKVMWWREPMYTCLSAERSSCLNVEIEPRIKWYGRGDPVINVSVQKGHHLNVETEPTRWYPWGIQQLVSTYFNLTQNAKTCLNFNFQGEGGFCSSQNSKYQDLPQFQLGGGGVVVVFCGSQNSKCQDLPKFQFFKGGGVL